MMSHRVNLLLKEYVNASGDRMSRRNDQEYPDTRITFSDPFLNGLNSSQWLKAELWATG
jgi:hypothetical protein